MLRADEGTLEAAKIIAAGGRGAAAAGGKRGGAGGRGARSKKRAKTEAVPEHGVTQVCGWDFCRAGCTCRVSGMGYSNVAPEGSCIWKLCCRTFGMHSVKKLVMGNTVVVLDPTNRDDAANKIEELSFRLFEICECVRSTHAGRTSCMQHVTAICW